MRYRLCCLLLCPVLFASVVSRAAEPPGPEVVANKQILKPQAFATLVNPNCSHCVDEARRRAGQLRDDDRVLAWIRGKYEGGAVPWRFFLVPYRVISDTYGVFVYDADAGYVRGYEPSLDFRFAGWRNGVMVLRHKDGTLYSALSGRAFDGPRRGEQLKPIATLETNWGFWSKAYPGSVAYHMFDKYQPMELPRRESPDSLQTRLDENPRQIDGQTRIVGLALNGKSKAWPLAALEAAGGLIEDTLAGQKLVVLWYPPTQTAAIYAPEVEGAEPKQTLSVVRDGAWQHAAFRDRQTGSRWGIEGRALEGPLQGKTLRWLPGVQCRWFAWAAEYPETDLQAGPRDTATPAAAAATAPDGTSQPARPVESPLSAVIVSPEAVNRKQAAAWRRDGYQAAVVVLDERNDGASYKGAARALAETGLDLHYWIEVGRQEEMARAHPEWVASLGMHDDWQRRFADVPKPAKGEVAKAFPWVPVGYRAAYEAHLKRIERLLERAAGDYQSLLLNDLQGAPASCGCGNLQCRWAIDYGVASTAEKLPGDDIAARFVGDVARRAGGKQVVPVWLTECEDGDLPADRAPGGKTTGYCGGVGCSQSTCPKVFTRQWTALLGVCEGPVGLLAVHQELGRHGGKHGAAAEWIGQAVDYLEVVPPRHGGRAIGRKRLWVVVQGYDIAADQLSQAKKAAASTGAGAVLVALTRLDQSYEPRIVNLDRAR